MSRLLHRLKSWTLQQESCCLWGRWGRSWSEATAWCWGTGATEPEQKSAWLKAAGTKLGEWKLSVTATQQHQQVYAIKKQTNTCTYGVLLVFVSCRDIGSMDAYSYLQIDGRIKDMIIRGGENIYPAEIEQFLHTHPKVREAQVSSNSKNPESVSRIKC